MTTGLVNMHIDRSIANLVIYVISKIHLLGKNGVCFEESHQKQ